MEFMSKFLYEANSVAIFISDHLSEIITVLAIAFLLYTKIKSFIKKSNEEKIAIAKKNIKDFMLSYVSKAEKDYAEWVKAGETKRAQVLLQIYTDYPILNKVIDQENLIAWIDEIIKEALKKMREMVTEK